MVAEDVSGISGASRIKYSDWDTQIRTLRKPLDIAGGEIQTSAVYLSSNNHGTETAAIFNTGTGD